MSSGYLNQDFQQCLKDLNDYGIVSAPRGAETKELLNYNITLRDPRNRLITMRDRNTKLRYLLGEFIWYLGGAATPDDILPYSKFWAQITNVGGPEGYVDGTINSNYGTRFFGHRADTNVERGYDDKVSQWNTVIDILRKDKDSRQAIMNVHLPSDRWAGNKDVPCTLSLQFFIRDNALHLIVNMRSNDIILGFTNDVFQFTMLQEAMLLQLQQTYPELQLGFYYHNAGSMHIYDRHYDMQAKIIADPQVIDVSMVPMDKFSDEIMLGLYTLEDLWRKAGMNSDFDVEAQAAWSLLTPYWQDLFRMCFLDDAEAFHRVFGDNEDEPEHIHTENCTH
jgi:thymidylate synthase